MLRRAALALVTLMIGCGSAVEAHPHVWIDANLTFVFDQKMLTGVQVEWTFDDIFSTLVIREHDKNHNKKLEPAEIESVRNEAFIATKDYGYFTHISLGGKKAQTGEARDFTAEIVKGKLVYRFTLPLAQPVDPVATGVSVLTYDESFYVDVGLEDADPVRFAGMPNGLCTFDIGVAPVELGTYGKMDLKKVQLLCPVKK